MDGNVILKMSHITKRFPGTLALDDVQLVCEKGKVHVLLGENGAGKSTLVKIISGVYSLDEGEMWYDGETVHYSGVRETIDKGISMIHQELNLLSERTIAQNIFIGHEPRVTGAPWLIDYKKMVRESEALLRNLGVELDPNMFVKELSIAQRQMVEVVKALSNKIKLLIMDEPTSSLTQKEIDKLFEIVERLKKDGVAIIYISHRMDEIKRIGDQVTIMRDGRYIGTLDAKTMELDDAVAMMVGRKISKMYVRNYRKPGKTILKTDNLCGLRFRNINISVCEGEIVSLSGLIGAGRTEIAKALFGYEPIVQGSYSLFDRKIGHPTPKESIRSGMAFLPEDRKTEGLILSMSIRENTVSASLKKTFPNCILDEAKETAAGNKYKEMLRIAAPDVNKLVGELSGGNQQKVAVGKWLHTGCRFLIFDEPTRGIDIGAKAEIYQLMDKLVNEGYGILMISSELNEVIGMSDRVYIMQEGEIRGELSREELTQQKIMAKAIGGRKTNENSAL
ncbi:sugar ABC transporter ATP-binding protein [Oribacterium sp. oral taxon 102]|uniref:sugar ABC transporter ATP-binding protein n=1 Tax=Oribacterium sp. oral taxon 102 TaxID=671214 RepID=UPI0015B96203|nr:sugar ABC transporter ATP-binding protein [Oribacterium sp. oral taxon 102]NWO21040.1 sugar ABC transporter ATP-binding protein [Oribacterium sp. oral taxon 102]